MLELITPRDRHFYDVRRTLREVRNFLTGTIVYLFSDELLTKQQLELLNEQRRLEIAHICANLYETGHNLDCAALEYIAKIIDENFLPKMIKSEWPQVRKYVAKRIDVDMLPQMINDDKVIVRKEVAARINEKYLEIMINDESSRVRIEVVKRLPKNKALLISGIDKNKKVRDIAMNTVLGL
jgi:hypothetical protein